MPLRTISTELAALHAASLDAMPAPMATSRTMFRELLHRSVRDCVGQIIHSPQLTHSTNSSVPPWADFTAARLLPTCTRNPCRALYPTLAQHYPNSTQITLPTPSKRLSNEIHRFLIPHSTPARATRWECGLRECSFQSRFPPSQKHSTRSVRFPSLRRSWKEKSRTQLEHLFGPGVRPEKRLAPYREKAYRTPVPVHWRKQHPVTRFTRTEEVLADAPMVGPVGWKRAKRFCCCCS